MVVMITVSSWRASHHPVEELPARSPDDALTDQVTCIIVTLVIQVSGPKLMPDFYSGSKAIRQEQHWHVATLTPERLMNVACWKHLFSSLIWPKGLDATLGASPANESLQGGFLTKHMLIEMQNPTRRPHCVNCFNLLRFHSS